MLRKLLVELVHRVIRLRARPHKATPIQRMAEGSLSPRGRVRVRGHSCLRSAFIYAPFVRQKLIIFVKAPCPGFVKTRLAEAVGPEKACVAYRKLVTTLLDRLGPIKEVELRFAPDDAASQMAPWLRPAWTAAPQRGGDLGERIRAAFDDAFAAGCERVTIIGSDCPAITANDIAPLLAPRPADSNKGLYGHVLVIGGSLGKAGAAAMAGMAALRGGAGLATVATAKSVLSTVAGFHPELMTESLPETAAGTIAPSRAFTMKRLTSYFDGSNPGTSTFFFRTR